MIKFWRIAAYTFIAMSGMYAWLSMQAGWRQYLGLALFLIATVRILALVYPKKQKKQEPGSTDRKPSGTDAPAA